MDYFATTMKHQPETTIYGDSLILLEGAVEELKLRIEMVRRELSRSGQRDPIEYCKARIKSEESMKEKLKRSESPLTSESALNNIYDAAGMRIICTFIDDVYWVADMLRGQEDINIFKIKDYIKSPKQNGYRSYHLIIKMPVRIMERVSSMYVEVQIRTIAMDCWASLEHQLKYKKHIENQELISSELKRCSDEIASTDLTLQTIRDLIRGI